MKRMLAVAVLALVLAACQTPTKIGVSIDAPLVGHVEISADPVKAITREATPTIEALSSAIGIAPTCPVPVKGQ